jgi:Bacterial Ig-like domain
MTWSASRSASTAKADRVARRARLPVPVLPLAATLAITVLAAAACSRPTDVQPFPGSCGPVVAVSWQPLPESIDAPRDAPIRVTFNDFPDPDTLGASDFIVTTGVYYVTGAYSVDLMGKAIVFRPSNMLRTGLGYSMTVLPPLHALSGCPATYDQRGFVTGDTVIGAPLPPAVPFAAVQPILARSCAGAACHRAPADQGGGCLPAPAEGLSLCDAQARSALIAVPSRQVSHLPLVDPRNSARSYLLRKIVPTDSGGPIPTVLGQREPPGAPLTPEEIATIAAWIDSGASE